jgi:hypothetical protein
MLRVMRGEREPPKVEALLKSQPDWFDKSWASAKRVTVTGLATAPLEFRFDTLTTDQRQRLQKACFEIDERRAAEIRCKTEARGRVRHELEEQLFDAKQAWCHETRDARRAQLVAAFLRGVSAARNGGARVAAAFEDFIETNPDVIATDARGATQSCPDPHFLIAVTRLRPVLERITGSAGASPQAVRHLVELLKEPGVVISTMQLKFDPPPPDVDAKVWDNAIHKAEQECVASTSGGDRSRW